MIRILWICLLVHFLGMPVYLAVLDRSLGCGVQFPERHCYDLKAAFGVWEFAIIYGVVSVLIPARAAP